MNGPTHARHRKRREADFHMKFGVGWLPEATLPGADATAHPMR